ncbi:MAG: SpoIIE family protein phosphatase, partial [Calditrichae bacterium]|nr:SpoIIE family protein phosphatase [Calditrichia bacterium]
MNSFIEGRAARVRNYSNYQMIFTSIPITLAVLHMLLFAFFPGYRENFFYSICMVGFAALSFSNFQIPFSTNVDEIVLHNKIVFSAINIAFLFGLLTAYIRGYQKLPGHSLIFILISTIFVIWMWVSFNPALFNYFYIYLGIAGLELLRVLFRPNFRTKKGEWIFGIGFIGLLLAVAYQVLIEMDILESIGGNDIVYVYGILILSVAVSINLARDFAKTHEQLIEREREAREHEIERRMLEAENERKTRELEEARNLQLSMLPKTIPKISNLDIAVYMKTATEVGGDYYDFNITGDGSLTVAIGDATGHGTKAGIMVTLIKSLFNTMGNTFYLPDFFQHCTRMIKRMHLGNLYMAMMLVRIRDHQLTASAAGMPPLLIYRKDTKQVEEMEIKGLPLGGVERFSYREVKNSLNPGD